MQLVNSNPLNEPITFTQGDTVTLNLLALDDENNPVDITGAVLNTQILGPNTVGPVTFGPGQHTVLDQSTNRGEFTLALGDMDTLECGEGQHKQIVTVADIASAFTYFHGNNILTVLVAVPLQ